MQQLEREKHPVAASGETIIHTHQQQQQKSVAVVQHKDLFSIQSVVAASGDTINHQQQQQQQQYDNQEEEEQIEEKKEEDNLKVVKCLSCSSLSSNSANSNYKRDDVATKNEYCRIPLEDFLQMKCNSNLCEYGGKCIQKTTIEQLERLREKIWGCFNSEAPTASQRKKIIDEILQASFVKHKGKFRFITGGEPGNYNLVCEAGYLILLGLSKNRNASQCSYQWKQAKNRVLGKTIETFQKPHKKEKADSATAYISYITNKIADTSPYAGKRF
jgi:hypothetical protein